MRLSWRKTAVLATAAIAAAALVVPAIAQETPAEEPGDAPAARDQFPMQFKEDFAAALAEELGIPVDQVADALPEVRETMKAQRQERLRAALEERLEQAVDDGVLTQAEADAVLKAVDEGIVPLGGPLAGGFFDRRGAGRPGEG